MEITREMILSCVFGTLTCAAFGVQFNIRPKHLAAAAVGSFLCRLIYLMISSGGGSYVKCTVAAAAAAAVYSEIMARRMHVPANMYLITSIIPLVPGDKLYYMMSALVVDDIESAAELGLTTVITAGSVAVGIFIVTSVIKIISGIDFGRLSEITVNIGKNKGKKKGRYDQNKDRTLKNIR